MPDINDILKKLLEGNVEFVLIGGLAALTYGVSTMTQDIDVCFSFQPENISRVLKSLEQAHPRVRAGPGFVPLSDYDLQRLAQLDNLYIRTDWGELDLLGTVAGIGRYPEAKTRSIEVQIFGWPCHILDIDSLIQSKESLNRPKDRQVVLELQVIREKMREGG